MKEKLPKILLVLVLFLILGNLGYLDYRLNNQNNLPVETEGQVEKSDCSLECQQLVEQKIAYVISQIPTQIPIQKPAKTSSFTVPNALPTQSQTRVSYIPLATAATINSSDWTDIIPSDFYLDLADYSGVKSVRLEVYLKSQYQSGKVYLRLYDVTNKRAVDYSDLSSSSETFELRRSSDLTIWRGNNLYRLQGKTSSGIEGYLKEAKLKILQ